MMNNTEIKPKQNSIKYLYAFASGIYIFKNCFGILFNKNSCPGKTKTLRNYALFSFSSYY